MARIIRITEILSLKKVVDNEIIDPESTLIAFDVDMTLTMPSSPEAQAPSLKKYHKQLKKIVRPLSSLHKDIALTIASQAYGQQLVDETILDVISYINERNIKMMGFTASLSGRIDGLGCVKESAAHIFITFLFYTYL
ncbi:MAG: hypothetical protein ACX93T_03220 [Bacteroidota bacterium]